MPGIGKRAGRVEDLRYYGFKRVGTWRCDQQEESVRLALDSDITDEPGVYAFVADETVRYVGSGSGKLGLYERLHGYASPKGYRSRRPMCEGLLGVLMAGRSVDVYVLIPRCSKRENDPPIDWALGIEAGLIDWWEPEWNRRGKGRKRAE